MGTDVPSPRLVQRYQEDLAVPAGNRIGEIRAPETRGFMFKLEWGKMMGDGADHVIIMILYVRRKVSKYLL